MKAAGSSVTPFVLTFNEADNLERALDSLRWAQRVVVLDSGSTDSTLTIAKSFDNVSIFSRKFDSFKGQSEHALQQTEIESEFALALDADMATPREWVDELVQGFLPARRAGAFLPFEYRIDGSPLMGSMLRPQLRLFRVSDVEVVQEGHGHKFQTPRSGPAYHFRTPLVHDDRKPLERWVSSQLGYSRIETARLASGATSLPGLLRRAGLMPVVAGVYAYGRAGGPFRGRAALRYAWERVVYECLLSMRLLAEQHTDDDPKR